jgi:hypothetical protein
VRVERSGPLSLLVDFDSEEELQAEQRANLAVGGLFLRTAETVPPLAVIEVRLRLPGRGETTVKASVVGTPPGALALQLQGTSAGILAALMAAPVAPASALDGDEAAETADTGTLWDRLRAMTPPQKMLLAPKADRVTRALLVQDTDPMVLFALLKNPRLGIDEVVRVAKSSYLGFQAAELIIKTAQWSGNLDVRVALIHNPKLPLPLALRILPSLPDSEVRLIAKGAATSAGLKQAALRRVIGG